jgi:hypothetical protein
MLASAFEAFLGQAPEDRNGYCLKKHKETQKGAVTPATKRASANPVPFFEFFSIFAAFPLRGLGASA